MQYPGPSASLNERTLHVLHLLHLHCILHSASTSQPSDRPSFVALTILVKFTDARTEGTENALPGRQGTTDSRFTE
jgi:hypothetical protein